jgi:hypothetical protein
MHSSHVAECPDLGPGCRTSTPPTPYNHVLTNYVYGATIDAQLGVLPWLSLAAALPIRAVTTEVKYTTLDGRAFTPDPPDPHHSNRTIVGLADPAVLAIAGTTIGRFGFALRGGALLPFGRTLDEDPFHLGHEGKAHEHVQFGAGTVRPMLGSALAVDFGAVGIDTWTVGILSFATNSHGYRAGQRFVVGGRVSSALGSKGRFGLGSELSRETADTWHGSSGDDGNLGRTDVVALLTARYPLARGLGAYAVARVPLYVNAVGGQLSYPVHLQLGIATALPL